jgi:hypothetical protein
MPRKIRILGWLKGDASSPVYKPSKFRGSALRGKTSPLPISVALPKEWENDSRAVRSQTTKDTLNSQENVTEEQEEPLPFGEIRPGATDLRRYLDPSWKD